MKQYLDDNGNPNETLSTGLPLLKVSLGKGSIESAELLLNSGAYVNGLGVQIPLMTGISTGKDKFIEYLVLSGANINIHGEYGRTPLMEAVRFSRYSIFKYLLQEGADIYSQDIFGSSVLHYAVLAPLFKYTWSDLFKNFSCYGIEPGTLDETNKIICILLKKGLDPKSKNFYGHSALDLALRTRQYEIVKMLANGKDIRINDFSS